MTIRIRKRRVHREHQFREQRVELRGRFSRNLRQMGPALRLLRGADEAAHGARLVAGVLDGARPRSPGGTAVEAPRYRQRRHGAGHHGALTRWGRYRYNIAMHLDGYGKEHIAVGSDKIYVEADKDGFITCGLLWTPGSTIYYCNGKEVFRWESPKVSRVPSDMMLTIPMAVGTIMPWTISNCRPIS